MTKTNKIKSEWGSYPLTKKTEKKISKTWEKCAKEIQYDY